MGGKYGKQAGFAEPHSSSIIGWVVVGLDWLDQRTGPSVATAKPSLFALFSVFYCWQWICNKTKLVLLVIVTKWIFFI